MRVEKLALYVTCSFIIHLLGIISTIKLSIFSSHINLFGRKNLDFVQNKKLNIS